MGKKVMHVNKLKWMNGSDLYELWHLENIECYK